MTAAGDQIALVVDGVSKRYGDFVAVDSLSFTVPSGVIYGVLGPNGAGKTTTLRIINDILVPDGGRVSILGDLVPGPVAGRRIGYLPEERGLYPKMRVLEVLVFFAQLRGVDGRTAQRRAHQWLERLGIAEWARNRVQDLSKGMQQKVQFVTALIHEPDLLILDEPWSGLDPINASVLREIVLEHREAGRTIVFSTHLMEQAEKLCDRVCIIARGKKVLDGELRTLKREAATGRSIAIRFANQEATDQACAGPLGVDRLVERTRVVDGGLEIELAAAASAEQLLAALVDAKLPVVHFVVREPSLHQIFVDRVGVDAATESRGHA